MHSITIALLLSMGSHASTIVGGEISNGNFNADSSTIDDRSFASTPNWFNLAGADSAQATRTTLPPEDGSRNAVLSVGRDFINDASWTIAKPGEVFEISFEWRDAFNWDDDADFIEVFFFTVAGDVVDDSTSAADITLLGSFIPASFSSVDSSYESFSNLSAYTTTADDVDKTVFVGFRMNPDQGEMGEFARVDNFTFSVNEGSSGTVLPTITAIDFEAELNEVTIAFSGLPNTTYVCTSSFDLSDFPTTESPIKGTEVITNDEGLGTFILDRTGSERKFYRLESSD